MLSQRRAKQQFPMNPQPSVKAIRLMMTDLSKSLSINLANDRTANITSNVTTHLTNSRNVLVDPLDGLTKDSAGLLERELGQCISGKEGRIMRKGGQVMLLSMPIQLHSLKIMGMGENMISSVDSRSAAETGMASHRTVRDDNAHAFSCDQSNVITHHVMCTERQRDQREMKADRFRGRLTSNNNPCLVSSK